MEETKFTEPTPPKVKKGDDVSPGEMDGFKIKLRMVIDQQRDYDRNKSKVLRLIMQQCSTAMKNKVEGSPEHPELEEKDDVIGLLKLIEQFAFSTENVQYEFWTQQASMRTLLTMQQQPKESLANYERRHTAQTEVTETVCGKLILHKYSKEKPDEQEKVRNKLLSAAFLAGVDRDRHKQAIDDLNNSHILGKGSYPEDVPSMVQYLNNRRGGGGSSKQIEANKDGMMTSFAQTSRVQCWKCNEYGHTKKDCPKKKQGNEARTNAQVEAEGGVRIQSTGRSNAGPTAWNGAQLTQLGISAEADAAAASIFHGMEMDG